MGMQISPVSFFKINNICPTFTSNPTKKSGISDTFEIVDSEAIYQKNLEKIVQKLTSGVVDKTRLDSIVQQYPIEDRELVQEIFCQSAPILTYNGFLNELPKLFEGVSSDTRFITLGSNVVDLIAYNAKRSRSITQCFKIDKLNINDDLKKYGWDIFDHCVVDTISKRKLTQDEIESLCEVDCLKLIDCGNFEVLPNFVDFSISDDLVKKKIDSLLVKIKKEQKKNPDLPTVFVLQDVLSIFAQNYNAIHKARKEHGCFETNYSKINTRCPDYEKIEDYLNLIPSYQLTFYEKMTTDYKAPTIADLYTKKTTEYEKLTVENLDKNLKRLFDNSKEMAQIIASDEFTYYTPEQFVSELRVLMQKFKAELKENKLKFSDCIFVYKNGKSDAFIGYLLEQMGEIKKEQRYEINQDIPDNKILVFVDDIVGSGETAQFRLNFSAKKRYCLSIVSCEQGKECLDDSIKLIYNKDSFNGINSRFKLIKESAINRNGLAEKCNSSEMFYFSCPDNSMLQYNEFASRILNIKFRLE